MSDHQVPLKNLFANLQRQLTQELTTHRECIPHQGEKGSASEECWREMLRTHLPKRYRIEKAFVVDCRDNRSEQIDIVVFDQQYAPFLFNQHGAYFVPAESVYAVIDVKQEISKRTMEEAGAKAASVRRLHRTNAVFGTADGPRRKHALFEIPAGIVALSSGWTAPALGTAFEDVVTDLAKLEGHRLDFGCAVASGAFSATYTHEGPLTIDKSGNELALVTFLWQLVARLQTQGTAPAIEVPEYFKALR